MLSLAPAQGCWPAERMSPSEPGHALPVKPTWVPQRGCAAMHPRLSAHADGTSTATAGRVDERTSLCRGWSTSTVAVPAKEGPRRLAPKALAAEKAPIAKSFTALRTAAAASWSRRWWANHRLPPRPCFGPLENAAALKRQSRICWRCQM